MSNAIDELKSEKRKKLEYFFGQEIKMTSKNYFRFKNVINNDVVILLTTNIRTIKDKLVLVTGKNKGLFLKNWQIIKLNNHQKGINCYAVKLYREYFSPYNFGKIDFGYVKPEIKDFDELIEIVKKQDEENISFAEGWSNYI